jgi:peptide/nickel transport system permease protein
MLMFLLAFHATGTVQKEQEQGFNPTAGMMGAYIEWWEDVFNGDMTGPSQPPEIFWIQVRSALENSLVLVLLTLLVSFVAGLGFSWLLLSHPENRFLTVMERMGYLSGAVPVFLIAIVIYELFKDMVPSMIFTDSRQGFAANLPPFILAAAVLSFGSGALGELVRVFKVEIGQIGNEPYVLAARARSANVIRHVAKAAAIPLASALISRIPFFLGASIVVERSFNIYGLGGLLLRSVDEANFSQLMFVTLMILGIVVTGRLTNKAIIAIVDPRAA